MTATKHAPAVPVTPQLVVPRRRRTVMVLVGVLLSATGGLTGGYLVTHAADTVRVLAVARPVAYGATVRDVDLRVVRLSSGPGVAVVPATRRGSVVGTVAATALTVGSLLTPSSVTGHRVPAAGEELAGVAVPAARMPARPLHAGDEVTVVSTPAEDADPPARVPASIDATVLDVGGLREDGTRVVDLRVPAGTGPLLAARAATDRVALVLEPPGQ